MAIIGLISDTHGLLREEAVLALRGSELIIHSGDVGKPEIITTLREVAPTIVVRGNIDKGPWASDLPTTAVTKFNSTIIYVLHRLEELDLDPATAGFQVVVSGHSHQPSREERRGVLYVNPGSAGPRRFRLPVTIARLDLGEIPWKVEFVELSTGELSNV